MAKLNQTSNNTGSKYVISNLHNSPIPLEELGLRSQRALHKEDLQRLYTEEELDFLLGRKAEPSEEWYGMLHLLRKNAKEATPRQRRRWSYIEDKFLIDTYNHLSDNDIGLALNIPVWEVSKHRLALKLEKRPEANSGSFVVWHYRDDFEKDMKEQNLSKVRPIGHLL